MTDKTPLERITEKLEEARGRVEGYGAKYGAFVMADDALKIVDAQLEDDLPPDKKTVAEKESWIRRHPRHEEAVEAKRLAAAEWKAAEVWMKLILEECGALRSQEATNRWIDKGHT